MSRIIIRGSLYEVKKVEKKSIKMKKYLIPALVLCSLTLFNCNKKEKTEKQIKVQMNMVNDSTAEATITITEETDGEKNEVIKVIKGTPDKVKSQIDSLK